MLIVEDEVLIALDLADRVEDVGCHVVGQAVDLASCIRIAKKENPDIALMDMNLKNNDSGADAARWLRENLDIPCIFVSRNLDEATRKVLSKLEPIGFVGKPFLSSQLAEALFTAKNSARI